MLGYTPQTQVKQIQMWAGTSMRITRTSWKGTVQRMKWKTQHTTNTLVVKSVLTKERNVRFRRNICAQATPSQESEVRVRFAPSPTGNLHVGGARTALFNWIFARKMGGKFVLRVEDTDRARSTLESEQVVLRDLTWLGLDWDEGPDVGGDCGPYRQSERLEIYQARCQELIDKGLAYPCFCTDEELAKDRELAEKEGRPPIYNGPWASADPQEVEKKIANGDPYAVRFRVPKDEIVSIQDAIRGQVKWNTNTLGDFIILRSDKTPVYNFCVAIDDASMKISHVIRAEEHLPNTLRQVLIYNALGWSTPQFCHVSLILAPDKSKLSKRHGATSVGEFQQEGYLSDALVNYLALLGWNDGTEQEIYSRDELMTNFSLERITKSAAVFDKTKLSWMNSQYIKTLPDESLISDLHQLWHSKGLFSNGQSDEINSLIAAFVSMCKESFSTINDSVDALSDLIEYPLSDTLQTSKAKKAVEGGFWDIAKEVLASYDSGEFKQVLQGGPDEFKTWMKGIGKKLDKKGKHLFLPMRIAVTGKMGGPDVGETAIFVKNCDGIIDTNKIQLVTIDSRMKELKKCLHEHINTSNEILNA